MRYQHDGDDRPPLPGAGYMEDYTLPFLCVAGVLCFIALFAIWALAGLPLVLIAAAVFDLLLPRR